MTIQTVGIVGLGLMGGSLARDLTAAGVRVVGHDRDRATMQRALADGVVAAVVDGVAGLAAVEVVVLAVPVRTAATLLAAEGAGWTRVRLVTDLGSTKESIGRAATVAGLGERFVGSHPLAGDHRSGYGASGEGMYRGAQVIVCPGAAGDAAIDAVHELWALVGGLPLVVHGSDHDRMMALRSHLPQLVSSALGALLGRRDVPHSELGPGGQDMTRLAGSSPEMWTDIVMDNGELIAGALRDLGNVLGDLIGAVEAGDEARVAALLEEARAWHRGTA